MIAIIRIHGRVGVDKDIDETLFRLKIRKKLACTLIDEKDKVDFGMLQKIRHYVAFGNVSDDVMKQLIEKRGETLTGKRIDKKEVDKILDEIKKGNWKIKGFFRLHPPIGGFKKSTKLSYPKGIIGKHEDISKLLLRML
ncbi:MAG: uL30 family ribosomal protein [Nanoarchaeota archaeon]|nr:uL30 family ribosomal protein [Nanoarchaeota archaeon]